MTMTSSQVMIPLPCYDGFLKFEIWHEPQLQNVSCYGLLSKEPISNPKRIDKMITLPFYPGCRYAAIPGTSNHDNALQVDIYSARPEHLVYHDHSLHLGDIKVHYLFM